MSSPKVRKRSTFRGRTCLTVTNHVTRLDALSEAEYIFEPNDQTGNRNPLRAA